MSVRVTPGSGRAGVQVDAGGQELRLRVTSPPVDGRANEEAAAVLAEVVGVKLRHVRLVSGHSSRSKRFHVAAAPRVVVAAVEQARGRSGPGDR